MNILITAKFDSRRNLADALLRIGRAALERDNAIDQTLINCRLVRS